MSWGLSIGLLVEALVTTFTHDVRLRLRCLFLFNTVSTVSHNLYPVESIQKGPSEEDPFHVIALMRLAYLV